tara:strand:- start:846 stop:1559 length:714 start_codon:yes stop_codon:yes gene_type:complete
MAISIDTIYQRVLALANKEQRGYITPQEFNLFANQAQQEIFEQYFYALNQATRIPGNDYVYADIDSMLEEKLQIFDFEDDNAVIGTYANAAPNDKILPDYIYRIHRIELNAVNCEILNVQDYRDVTAAGALVKPLPTRPIANIRNNVVRVFNGNFTIPTMIYYFRKPTQVRWAYFVINDKALHDTSALNTVNFELHDSEESELVYKILKFAGISMKRDDIMRAGQGMELVQTQQEKQ